MFFKMQNIGQAMHLTMLIAHPYVSNYFGGMFGTKHKIYQGKLIVSYGLWNHLDGALMIEMFIVMTLIRGFHQKG